MAATKLLSDNGVSSGITGYQLTGGNDGTLQLQTTTSGGTATTAMTIDTSQNVGIGTSSPAGKLNVSGSGQLFNLNGGGTSGIYSTIGNTGGSFVLGIQNSVGNGPVLGATGAYDALLGTQNATNQIFITNNTERMRIDSSGNLLVGTTSNHGSYPGRVYSVGANSLTCKVTSNPGNAILFINSSDALAGYINVNGTTTTYNSVSDYRLKENVQPMQNALVTVAQLKPCTYTWKADGSEGQGFIAHELQAVVPDCVAGEKDAVDAEGNPLYQGIDTSFLVATLTAAIQEQQALITQLQADVAALKGAA